LVRVTCLPVGQDAAAIHCTLTADRNTEQSRGEIFKEPQLKTELNFRFLKPDQTTRIRTICCSSTELNDSVMLLLRNPKEYKLRDQEQQLLKATRENEKQQKKNSTACSTNCSLSTIEKTPKFLKTNPNELKFDQGLASS
jgi:hypothetical protein